MVLMEGVMVLDGLSRAANVLISEWRVCEGWGINVITSSCVVVT